MENTEEHNGKTYLETDDMLNRVLDKIKMMIGIEKFKNYKILIDTEKSLAYEVTLKNVMISISCVVKADDKFYPQIFLEQALAALKLMRNTKIWLEVVKIVKSSIKVGKNWRKIIKAVKISVKIDKKWRKMIKVVKSSTKVDKK